MSMPLHHRCRSSRNVNSSTCRLSFEIICFKSDRSFTFALLGRNSGTSAIGDWANDGSDVLLSAGCPRLPDELRCLVNIRGLECECPYGLGCQVSPRRIRRRHALSYAQIATTYGRWVPFKTIMRAPRSCSAGTRRRKGRSSISGMRFCQSGQNLVSF